MTEQPVQQIAQTVTLKVWNKPAEKCELAPRLHRPQPLRFVWHHILPQAAGGKTEASNLIQLCDNCHYAVHRLLWDLSQGKAIAGEGSRGQRRVAVEGYLKAEDLGTTAKIPKEGLCRRPNGSPGSGSPG